MSTLCDSYSESNKDGYYPLSNYTGYPIAVGQTFTGNGGTLTSVKFYMKRYGMSTGNVYATVYAHTGTWGSTGKPTGSILAQSANVDVTSISNSVYELVTFTFSGDDQITLEDGVHYCVAVWYTVNSYMLVGRDESSPTHNGNAFNYVTSWNYSTGGYDLPFYVYTEGGGGGAFIPIITLL